MKKYEKLCSYQHLTFSRIDGDDIVALTMNGLTARLSRAEVDAHFKQEAAGLARAREIRPIADQIEDEMSRRVAAAIKAGGKKCRVIYSAYKYDDDVPVNNLDEVAIVGKVRMVADPDDFYGGSKSRRYESPVLESPTWLDLTVLANDMIHKVRDTHHSFFEGFDITGTDADGVQIAEFSMGS